MQESKIRIAVVGLHFGATFAAIYREHPNVGEVILCDTDPQRLHEVGERIGAARRFDSLDHVLAEPDIDAVHLLTPFLLHAEQAIRVLNAGKHCASAVCMGSTPDELTRIVETRRRTGLNYMMMETVVYSREFLFVKDLYDRGELGELTFLRGTYFQDVEGYPAYWKTVPPMHYATHAVAPLLALTNTRATKVSCLGSGRLSARLEPTEFSPFRLETALFRLENTDAAAEVTRSWFETARPYVEAFSVYGTKRSFEWTQLSGDKHCLFTLGETAVPFAGRPVAVERIEVPDYADRLPEPLRRFTEYAHDGAHGGSHPHLAHEFVRSIIEARPPAIDAVTAANWTAPGLYAHESALRDGEPVVIPSFG
ncbi:MAG: Gfo/Idh/MocA family oxidoreductase [Capsulimonadales bacterium]|nr:Gfo/Idh/MocA family oxidoreductase [Capsulimonadales bacterium]